MSHVRNRLLGYSVVVDVTLRSDDLGVSSYTAEPSVWSYATQRLPPTSPASHAKLATFNLCTRGAPDAGRCAAQVSRAAEVCRLQSGGELVVVSDTHGDACCTNGMPHRGCRQTTW